ncbi:MAG: rhomboid family intramembrane serine protease [bacterium]|nr:rhomboid family intramembrane serine protease [bacterium]
MREIGTFKEEVLAQTFSDFLLFKEIENKILDDGDGEWSVWVHDEERLEEAGELLKEFKDNPEKPEYSQYSKKADEKRFEEEQEEKRYQKKAKASQFQWRYTTHQGIGRVTMVMIIISVAVAIISGLGNNKTVISGLFITDFRVTSNMIQWRPGLPDVFSGELWRLLTPMFIHFGIMHILFNMLWLKDLGSQIEFKQSSRFFVILVVVLAAGSNVAQYIVSGPNFGGMSGVVYGLLGYIWMRGKHDPASGLFLERNIVIFMIVWFFLCMTGLMGNIANTAHGAGLLIGMAWGYISAMNAKNLRRL